MENLIGFLSYVHDDDAAEGRRIINLAEDLINQFQMLTGENVELFIDRKSIGLGEDWQNKIDSVISSIAFFIPIITPRYFFSPECRGELQKFSRKARNLGIDELIIPLYYVTVPELEKAGTDDDLISLVRKFQWEDWRELRFSDVTSEKYRRAVYKLACRLVEANKHTEETQVIIPEELSELPKYNNDDTPGTIELLASSEEKLNLIPSTLSSITELILQIGKITNETTEEIQRGKPQVNSFSARLMAIRKAANRMDAPINEIWELSNLYATQLHDVDTGFRIIINQAQYEIKDDPDTKASFCAFFETVVNLSVSSDEAMDSIQLMISSFEPLEKLSRDLRPKLRRLKSGLTNLIEATEVIREWVKMIESIGVECGE